MKYLEIAEFDGNKLTTVRSLPSDKCLRSLNLNNNLIKKIGAFKTLTELRIDNNALETFPKSILTMSNLALLSMKKNRIKEIPDHLDKLSSLIVFDISANLLTTIPDNICLLPKLAQLNVSMNLIDHLPNSMGQFPSIQTLQMACNKLKTIPALPESLVLLDVCSNEIASLPYLTSSLKELAISSNCLKETINLNEIELEVLDIANNKLGNKFKKFINFHGNYKVLNLASNDIAELPGEMFDLSVDELDLSYNNLHEISALNLKAKSLNLSHNELPVKDQGKRRRGRGSLYAGGCCDLVIRYPACVGL